GDSVGGHGATPSRHGLRTVQDSAVRFSGRLEPGGRIPNEKFLLNMTNATVVDLIRNLFLTTFWLSVPVLAAGFVIGILVSLAQFLHSSQDSSFSTVPRVIVFLGALLVSMPSMLSKLMSYTTALLGDLGRFA